MPRLVQAPHGLWKITVSRQRPSEENPQDPSLSKDNREETRSIFVCFPYFKTSQTVWLLFFITASNTDSKYLLCSGLSHTPRSDKSEIVFQLSEPNSYSKYIESMKKLLDFYDDEKQTTDQKFEDCGGEYELLVFLVKV